MYFNSAFLMLLFFCKQKWKYSFSNLYLSLHYQVKFRFSVFGIENLLFANDLNLGLDYSQVFRDSFKEGEDTELEDDFIWSGRAELDPLYSVGIEQPPWESLSKWKWEQSDLRRGVWEHRKEQCGESISMCPISHT